MKLIRKTEIPALVQFVCQLEQWAADIGSALSYLQAVKAESIILPIK